MKKKLLAAGMVAALATTAVVGGTMAYFTDTEQQTNVMTIGDVEINIEEACKNPNWTEGSDEKKYIEFDEELFTLFPIKDELGTQLFNKMVYTFNTSESKYDAYIRTIVLFEYNNGAPACKDDCLNGIHFGYSNSDYKLADLDNKQLHGSTNVLLDGIYKVNDKDYQVVVFTDKDEKAIPYGEALATVNGVWLDKDLTQEQVEGWYKYDTEGKLIDNDIDIIVFSQAIQAEGLTHAEAMEALGEVNLWNLNDWIKTDDAVINDFFSHSQETTAADGE